MLTGRHMVRDVSCKNCNSKLGWIYEFATEDSQRYKEGRVILERALVRESEGFEEHVPSDNSWMEISSSSGFLCWNLKKEKSTKKPNPYLHTLSPLHLRWIHELQREGKRELQRGKENSMWNVPFSLLFFFFKNPFLVIHRERYLDAVTLFQSQLCKHLKLQII